MSLIFDTHAHYDDAQFDADRDALLSAMPGSGVGLIVDPGCDGESSRAAVALAEKYPHVYAAVGWHPENCAPFVPGDLDALRELAKHPRVVAIGEIGLDYYWEKDAEKRLLQQRVFVRQLDLARQLHLPVCIHDREAHGDTLAILKKEARGMTGVLHCFSGSWEMAQEVLRMGWYLGVDGPLTYKNAAKLPEIVQKIPLDRLLLETDAPYLAPVPKRGKRNEPAYVVHVAEKVAELRNVPLGEIAAATTQNAMRLYRIK